MTVSSEEEASWFQKDIDAICLYSRDVRLELNDDKCVIMSYGHTNSFFPYEHALGQKPMKRVQNVKDLGITFDPRLTFHHMMGI
jgi:hypothetical protein